MEVGDEGTEEDMSFGETIARMYKLDKWLENSDEGHFISIILSWSYFLSGISLCIHAPINLVLHGRTRSFMWKANPSLRTIGSDDQCSIKS